MKPYKGRSTYPRRRKSVVWSVCCKESRLSTKKDIKVEGSLNLNLVIGKGYVFAVRQKQGYSVSFCVHVDRLFLFVDWRAGFRLGFARFSQFDAKLRVFTFGNSHKNDHSQLTLSSFLHFI
jgi:hypothetical protein